MEEVKLGDPEQRPAGKGAGAARTAKFRRRTIADTGREGTPE